MKTLYIVRHAKAEDTKLGMKDFDRCLTQRGKEQASQVSKILHKQSVKVDVILSSPAARALTTAQIIARGIHYPINEIQEIPDMYEASVEDLLEIISMIEPNCNSAMLVGHNPTISTLAQRFSRDVKTDLSTCAVVVLTFDQKSWEKVSTHSGILLDAI